MPKGHLWAGASHLMRQHTSLLRRLCVDASPPRPMLPSPLIRQCGNWLPRPQERPATRARLSTFRSPRPSKRWEPKPRWKRWTCCWIRARPLACLDGNRNMMVSSTMWISISRPGRLGSPCSPISINLRSKTMRLARQPDLCGKDPSRRRKWQRGRSFPSDLFWLSLCFSFSYSPLPRRHW